jgi:hypothetical protein
MQVPILNGIYTSNAPDYRVSYPVNLQPIAGSSGISNGYLRPGYGLVNAAAGQGVDRGGIVWNGRHYRVSGASLVEVSSDGATATLGAVGHGGLVTFDYSFDSLAVAAGGLLYYWDGSTLTQVTDPDLGNVIDFVWVDGYFFTTDGEFLVVTELNDPKSVNPLKYGSSEADPDPVKALLKLKNEVYALNRHTIEVFTNIGGDGFPFSRVEGAQIQKGAIGTHAACVFGDTIAFLGSGRNEAASIYLGVNSGAQKIASREVDRILSGYSESALSGVLLEQVAINGQVLLYVHLPDRCLVFDFSGTQAVGEPVWFVLTSATPAEEYARYKAWNHVYFNGKWWVGDPASSSFGCLSESVSSHWGENVRWEFGTGIAYNAGKGAIIHEMELAGLMGYVAFGSNPTIGTQYSVDGQTWSQVRQISAGRFGESQKRLVWMKNGHMRNWRIQRFVGDTRAHISMARLDVTVEPLAY